MQHEICIIGAGLFGSIIAKQLRSKNLDVTVLDNDEKEAGSKPAGCLMKPSWYSSIGPEFYKPGLETLESLYDVKTIEFSTKVKKTKVKRISPKEILDQTNKINYKIDFVNLLQDQKLWALGNIEQAKYCLATHVIIAAGIWCNRILKLSNLPLVSELSPMTGASFYIPGITNPEISLWRPYRQLVKFNIEPETIWVGDGTSTKNYTERHLNESFFRCERFVGLPWDKAIGKIGHRPYVKDAKPCYFQEHAPNLWVVTGGAKNGTIAAGWAAWKAGRIFDEL